MMQLRKDKATDSENALNILGLQFTKKRYK